MKLRPSLTLRPDFALVMVLTTLCLNFPGLARQGKSVDAQVTQSQEVVETDKLHTQVAQLFHEKKFQEALPMAKQVVELREKSLGLANEKTIASLKNLASIYTELNKYGDAVGVRERVLKAEETLYGSSSIKLGDNLTRLGWERLQDNKVGGAIDAMKRNLQIREAAFGAESKELTQTLNDLALLYQGDGNLGQSIAYFKRLLPIKEKEVRANHPDFAESLAKYAMFLSLANKKKEAEEYEARARAIYDALPDQPKPQTVEPNILKGFAILKVAPEYPMLAKSNRIRGSVLVQVWIDQIGTVTKAVSVSGPNELRSAAEAAAKQWRFKPTIVNGRAIKVLGILTFNFTL